MLGTLLDAGDLERGKNHCPAEACVLAGLGVRGGGRHKQANSTITVGTSCGLLRGLLEMRPLKCSAKAWLIINANR